MSDEQQVITHEAPPPAEQAADPKLARLAMFMKAAANPDIDVAKLAALRAMVKEDDEDERKRAFLDALAKFKAELPAIIKSRTVDFPHKERDDREAGGRTKYKYEELADIAAIVDPILGKYGLSYRFIPSQEGGKVKVSCILGHCDGFEDTPKTLEAPEDKTGQKNPAQAISSTCTYLERSTLKLALGLAAGRDDDGQGGYDDPPISADDVVYIEQLIGDTGSDLERLLKTVDAQNVANMRASQFKQAAWLLETVKRRDKAKAAADGTAQ
jgi:ERF superfamily